MTFRQSLYKALRITLIPSIEWKAIRNEKYTLTELFVGYIFPIILISALGRTIGVFFAAKPLTGYSLGLLKLLAFNIFSWVLIPYILMIVGSYVFYFILKRFDSEITLPVVFKLIVFTFTPFFLVSAIAFIHPVMRLLIPMGILLFVLYTVYVFWYGVQELIPEPIETKISFLVICIGMAYGAMLIANLLFSFLVNWLVPGMATYVL